MFSNSINKNKLDAISAALEEALQIFRGRLEYQKTVISCISDAKNSGNEETFLRQFMKCQPGQEANFQTQNEMIDDLLNKHRDDQQFYEKCIAVAEKSAADPQKAMNCLYLFARSNLIVYAYYIKAGEEDFIKTCHEKELTPALIPIVKMRRKAVMENSIDETPFMKEILETLKPCTEALVIQGFEKLQRHFQLGKSPPILKKLKTSIDTNSDSTISPTKKLIDELLALPKEHHGPLIEARVLLAREKKSRDTFFSKLDKDLYLRSPNQIEPALVVRKTMMDLVEPVADFLHMQQQLGALAKPLTKYLMRIKNKKQLIEEKEEVLSVPAEVQASPLVAEASVVAPPLPTPSAVEENSATLLQAPSQAAAVPIAAPLPPVFIAPSAAEIFVENRKQKDADRREEVAARRQQKMQAAQHNNPIEQKIDDGGEALPMQGLEKSFGLFEGKKSKDLDLIYSIVAHKDEALNLTYENVENLIEKLGGKVTTAGRGGSHRKITFQNNYPGFYIGDSNEVEAKNDDGPKKAVFVKPHGKKENNMKMLSIKMIGNVLQRIGYPKEDLELYINVLARGGRGLSLQKKLELAEETMKQKNSNACRPR